jgi:hypothetical protein
MPKFVENASHIGVNLESGPIDAIYGRNRLPHETDPSGETG